MKKTTIFIHFSLVKSPFSEPLFVGPLGNSRVGPLDGTAGFSGRGLQHRAAPGSQDATRVRRGEYWGDGGAGGMWDVEGV